MRNIIMVQKEIIQKVKATASLWSEDPAVRADPEYKGFRSIRNNRVFPAPPKDNYPILAVDVNKTLTEQLSGGDCAPSGFQLLVQIYARAGKTDDDIESIRESVVEQMYTLLDACYLSPVDDIVHFEDIIGSERLHCVGAMVQA